MTKTRVKPPTALLNSPLFCCCQELLAEAQERKAQLKEELSALREELDSTKHTHQQLSSRWREKAEVIGQLEKQVAATTQTWNAKEKALTAERDAALTAAG